MKLLQNIVKKFNISNNNNTAIENSTVDEPVVGTTVVRFLQSDGENGDFVPAMGDATYYTCLKILAESMGKLPCYLRGRDGGKITKGRIPYLLGLKPNQYQTAIELFTYLEFCRNHYGNAYAVVNYRKDGQIEGIYPLNPMCVQVYVNNTPNDLTGSYFYQYSGKMGELVINPDNMIHVKNWYRRDDNLLLGLPVKDVLYRTLNGVKQGQTAQNKMFKTGMSPNAVLKFSSDLSKDGLKKAKSVLNEVAQYVDSRMYVVPPGMELTPLTINLADSQFLEMRKYSSSQIAAAMGIPSQMLNDYAKMSYANATAQQLAFLQQTLSSIIEIYEQEFTAKLLTEKEVELGMSIKFNLQSLLRADPVQQATMLRSYVDGSIYTINEARLFAGLPPMDGCDLLVKMPGAETIGNNAGGNNETKSKE